MLIHSIKRAYKCLNNCSHFLFLGSRLLYKQSLLSCTAGYSTLPVHCTVGLVNFWYRNASKLIMTCSRWVISVQIFILLFGSLHDFIVLYIENLHT